MIAFYIDKQHWPTTNPENPTMFERLSRSWQLIKASAAVLQQDRELVLFPLISSMAMLGAGWTVATYLVVPVLVARDVGPVEAVKESALILKRTWAKTWWVRLAWALPLRWFSSASWCWAPPWSLPLPPAAAPS
jgi:hypothetical protein